MFPKLYRDYLGCSVNFPYGFQIGFRWVHCNGETSKTSAILFSWHHPKSITWRCAFYWHKWFSFSWRTQAHLWIKTT